MRTNHLNLLLALVGILVSVLLTAASLFVAGIAIGIVLGVAISPYIGQASVRLAHYLGQDHPSVGPSHTLIRSDEQPYRHRGP
jgi:hypothetical protein